MGQLRKRPGERPRVVRFRKKDTGRLPQIGFADRAGKGVALPGVADVGQHRAGFDRGELVRVAEQDQPGFGSEGPHQPRHQRQRHHRTFIDDHEVEGERIPGVVFRPVRQWRGTDQPVDGRGGKLLNPAAYRFGRADFEAVLAQRLAEAGLRLAGRGAQRDPEFGGAGEFQREQRRDHRGLAGAGAA